MEKRGTRANVLLHFADGSTRSISIRSRPKNEMLKLLLASMDFAYHIDEEPRSITRFEPLLHLFARATSVEADTNVKLLSLVHNILTSNEAESAESDVVPDVPPAQSTETQ
jgi:hypothetical protein